MSTDLTKEQRLKAAEFTASVWRKNFEREAKRFLEEEYKIDLPPLRIETK